MSGALPTAAAQPSGGVVVSGQAGITGSGNSTVITQATQKAIINWQDFSVAAGGTVQFAQPDAKSITLNRVVGSGSSAIDGTLAANGQVWILNPNGVLFGQGAQVNVGGLLATTADIADNDFVAGRYRFAGGGPDAAVENDGVIHAADGGAVVLSAAKASNRGLIQANAGTVVLGSASAFTIDFAGDNLLRYAVVHDEAAGGASGAVSNSGKIGAAGGTVLLTARAAGSVLDGVINNTGIIEAVSAREVNGQIILDAGEGKVVAGGAMVTSGKAAGETGGTIRVLGGEVEVVDGATMSASGDAGGGEIMIGGSFRGQGPLANADNTTVGKATMAADAITSGDGGTIVVWSDGKTRFGGSISAQGGAQSGNGGQVETSGAVLAIDPGAEVITRAPAGLAGEWLIDPDDLYIVDTGSEDTVLNSGVLAFDDGGSTILTDTIEAALLNGNVTLQANNDILVQGSVDVETGNTLELDAGRSIVFSGSGSLSNDGVGGRVVLSANDPGANAAKRGTGAGVISMEGFNSITADEIDLIVGENAAGGGIGTESNTITVNGDLYIETAGYDAHVDSFGLNLGNDGHATAVNLKAGTAAAAGNLALTVTGLTQTGAIEVNDLAIGIVGDVFFTDPIILTNPDNTIAGKVSAASVGTAAEQIAITNSQALTLGDISVYPVAEGNGDVGGVKISATSGGIVIDGQIDAGAIALQAAGDIVETANGFITSRGKGDGSAGGSLSVVSSDGKVSLPNANAIVPGIECVVPGCDPNPAEKINPGKLHVESGGDADIWIQSPVDLYGADSGGDFSLKVSGNYQILDEVGELYTVENGIRIFDAVKAGKFVTLIADGGITQETDISRDVSCSTVQQIRRTVKIDRWWI